jgi:hypothetical protein
MIDGEVWRDVPSVPGIIVSSEGRVMHIPYRGPMPKGGIRPYGGEAHFGVWNKQDGRFIVSIKGATYKVHQLIAEAFHGPPPFAGAVVMHIDENAANNRPYNLRWGTQQENLNAVGFLSYCRNRIGEANPYVKGRRVKRGIPNADVL